MRPMFGFCREQLLARMLYEGCSTLAEEDIERPILEVLAEHPAEARSFVLVVFWVLLDFSFWLLGFWLFVFQFNLFSRSRGQFFSHISRMAGAFTEL
jgi:hypothetical protein